MCTRPITQDGKTFACRTCDDCIAVRRHQWVARAMAEKSLHAHTLALTLTYSDETEAGRQGARMFCYLDVQLFFARVRAALRRRYPSEETYIRFLVAGEQGDRNGRCHWHVIIFSSHDLTELGEVFIRGNRLTDRASMMTVGKRKRRLNWSLWPLGFSVFQEPDQGGMNYVLSYALKDQFTHEKSRETMREAKAENFATGLFRMSKKPAIGDVWLWNYLAELYHKGAVLPSLQLRVPDFHGFWVPSGLFRQKVLWGLAAINTAIRWETGRDAPQWRSLLASLADNETDLEILTDGQKAEEIDWLADLAAKQALLAGEQEARNTRHNCGREIPCDACLNALDDETLADIGLEGFTINGVRTYQARPGTRSIQDRRNSYTGRPHGLCALRETRPVKRAFPGKD